MQWLTRLKGWQTTILTMRHAYTRWWHHSRGTDAYKRTLACAWSFEQPSRHLLRRQHRLKKTRTDNMMRVVKDNCCNKWDEGNESYWLHGVCQLMWHFLWEIHLFKLVILPTMTTLMCHKDSSLRKKQRRRAWISTSGHDFYTKIQISIVHKPAEC